MDLTTQMLQKLKDEKAAINEAISVLEHLARRRARGGRSTDREIVRSQPAGSVTAMANGQQCPSPQRK